ncbi:MAG: PAS domain S-box protein [Desulfofustis sp.]|nr:PAS domain S-box protein [Desulfofustis sp.]
MVLDLIKNIALLVTLAVGLRFLGYRLEHQRIVFLILAGILFGLVGVVGMMTPLTFAPGVIYDGRSIVLSLAGLFGGPVVAAIAAPICAAYRLELGGPGALPGVGVIVEAAALGVALYYLRRRDERWVSPLSLLLFGILVHLLMLGLQLLIPGVGVEAVRRIGPTVLLFFPVAFLLIAQIFLEVERRRSAEKQIRQSEEYYRSLFEYNQIPMLIVDPEQAAIEDANPAAAEFYGWSQERLRTMDLAPLTGRPSEEVRETVRTVRDNGRNRTFASHCRADGQQCQVDVFSGPIRVGGRDLLYLLVVDISERREAEEALRHSEAKQRAMIQASPMAIISIDRDSRVLSWNRAAETIFGWTAEELVGQPLPMSLFGSPEEFTAASRRVFSGERLVQKEFVRHRKDRSTVEVSVSAAPVRSPDGRIDAIVALIEDISQRKQTERDHEKLEQQLLQARKMEAVGQLAGGVAHDFNNLLQVIIGHGELLADDQTVPSSRRDNLEQLMNAAQRAAGLVRQLLAFSRRQVLEMQDLDMNTVIGECLKMARRVIGEHIVVVPVYGHKLATIRADRNQLEQILLNLLINARDAMPNGGTITVETENVLIDESYRQQHPYARTGRYVLLSVIDTGCGMDEETRNRVFEPFFTTKGLGRGTGLGLATVYGLVRQHDGLIHVYSELEKGTSFKIYLPAVERSAAAVGDKIHGAVMGGSETILVAEDEVQVLKLTATILEHAGYRVLTAGDGEEALALFRRNPDAIDLVLLDVIMPKLGGFAVYEQMKALRRDVRVIFTSGYSINAIHTDFVLYEGLQLIQKPCGREDLLRKIRSVLDA